MRLKSVRLTLLALILALSACATAPAPPPPPPPPPPYQQPPPPPPPPPAMAPPEFTTRSVREIDIRPVLVDISREQDRTPANGGSSVIVLSSAEDPRSSWLCAQFAAKFQRATFDTVKVGFRRDASGAVEAVRPVYWPFASPPADNTCRARVAAYDYTRARVLRDRFGLVGPGPFLLVASADGRRFSSINFAGRSYGEMDAMVEAFRDAFAYESGIWDSASSVAIRQSVAARLTRAGYQTGLSAITRAFRIAATTAARAGCRLNDLRDAAC